MCRNCCHIYNIYYNLYFFSLLCILNISVFQTLSVLLVSVWRRYSEVYHKPDIQNLYTEFPDLEVKVVYMMEGTNNQDENINVDNNVDNNDGNTNDISDIEEEDSHNQGVILDQNIFQRLKQNDPAILI